MTCARVRGNLTAVIWEDKWVVYKLMNTCRPPAEGIFCDEAQKPVVVTDYTLHTCYVGK